MTERRALDLHGRRIEYALKRSKRRRTIGLRVSADGLSVTVPWRASAREADRVVCGKAGWVIDKLDKWAARPAPVPLRGEDGEIVSWLGSPRTLRVVPHARARTLITLDDDAIAVQVDETLTGDLKPATVRRALERWRRREAEARMTPLVARYAAALGLPAPNVLYRAQKSRWGSCASDGAVRMNVRLMHHAPALIEHVCAHEACHLIEMNHGPRFYALMDRVQPGHRALARALKDARPEGAAF